MNKDDIIRMAEEAGFAFDGVNTRIPLWISRPEELEHFAALVAAAEREACAKVCDYVSDSHIQKESHSASVWAARECAAAIRARGQK
jgi:hypothetical protein